MADSPEEIQKHVKAYMIVGGTLIVFTFLTVVVAWITPSITVGLAPSSQTIFIRPTSNI